MGGTLANLWKGGGGDWNTVGSKDSAQDIPLFGAPKNPPAPSTGSQVLSGGIRGAMNSFSQPQQPQPGGGQILQPGPGPAPVDPSYFAPSGGNAFYGR
jgi:hypothetical protein